jgi:ABC-type transporter Mla subunit MlaD
MNSKNIEETIQQLLHKKNELEIQSEKLRSQLNTMTDAIHSIRKNFEALVADTHSTTLMYDRVVKEYRNELAAKGPEQSVEKKKAFTLSDFREKILDKEKKLPRNASISQLASQLTHKENN